MTPQVSVIMPVYNGARFVRDAVKSVLGSVGPSIELLLADDGSADNSVDAALAAANGDDRMRVLRLPHGGVGRARQAALEAARGPYIANVDSDDMTFPDRFARQVACLERDAGLVAIGTRVLAVDADGRPLRILIKHFAHDEIEASYMALRSGALGNPSAMFRREAAQRVGGYDVSLGSVCEDTDLWLRLGEVGRLANLPDVLVRYRVHGANVSIDGVDKASRHAVLAMVVARARARRGIEGESVPAPPAMDAVWERPVNRALMHHFRGHRASAVAALAWATLRHPTEPATHGAIRTVLSGAPQPTPSPLSAPRTAHA